MYHAMRDAQLVHMTAFTYRFAPSMRYMRHLLKSGELGEPRHFRSQRFLDLPETCWGWRQYVKTEFCCLANPGSGKSRNRWLRKWRGSPNSPLLSKCRMYRRGRSETVRERHHVDQLSVRMAWYI